jgi:hypothetical protein
LLAAPAIKIALRLRGCSGRIPYGLVEENESASELCETMLCNENDKVGERERETEGEKGERERGRERGRGKDVLDRTDDHFTYGYLIDQMIS